MRTIPLTQNKVALVDDADFDVLSLYSWRTHLGDASTLYARAHFGNTSVYMHRFLLRPERRLQVHHIDGNGLNNQRANLSVVSSAFHIQVTGARSCNKTGFKGVNLWTDPNNKSRVRYRARITQGGKDIFFACFRTAEEAALAYDAKARELFGPLAYQNFPSDAGKVRDAANGE